ncbi:YihY/virulence factor BrkB family protein [Marinococcus sp. PL1-022]|uniref:YihY/virulence factor BrkB family protein n=1 Tax=Marinococcus sp. PL1-022 TaxID=3095363 RepID=UPI0029C5EB3B|nr:YihY/virulence factor BrkB family protein [Marinococcus sp. PL1-022]MDX6154407.1 YihY/virulence factor BrkB family protein [Marinococcus sp. PL1-022]
MNTIKSYAKELMGEFKKDDVPLLAAAQSYYYLLSIFPMMILILTILPFLNIDSQAVVTLVQNTAPSGMTSVLEDNILSIVETPRGGLFTIGLIGALWSASNGINAFINASNTAYDIEETRSFLKVRGISIALTLGMIIALAAALILPIFGNLIIDFINSVVSLPPQTELLFQILRWVVALTVMSAVLLVLYRFAPNKTLKWKEILPGAITAAVLWQLISLAFSFYVSNFGNYSATYGSLGGIIILMLWFFLTGMILMIGAELNVIYHRRHGKSSHASPEES